MEFDTYSEELFFKLCTVEGIEIKKIETQTTKTPDYHLAKGTYEFGAEVKKLEDNHEEKSVINRVYDGNTVIDTAIIDGHRIKSKIKKAGPQLKKVFKGEIPTILVIFDKRHFLNQFDSPSEEIKSAMFGEMETWISQEPHDEYIEESVFGRNKKFTRTSYTSISAIAHIYSNNSDDINMSLYHNPHASAKFKFGFLSSSRIKEFEIPDFRNWSRWREIKP